MRKVKEKEFYLEQVDLKKLRKARKEKGVLQKDLANQLQCSVTTYSDKENGRCRFTFIDIKRIKDYLGLTKEETIDIFLKNIL